MTTVEVGMASLAFPVGFDCSPWLPGEQLG
jgi:hypothetical protein